MRFEFAGPTKIIFGEGSVLEAASLARSWGSHVLLFTGASERTTSLMHELLSKVGMPLTLFRVEREPSIEMIEAGVRAVRDCGADVIVGCGGGSTMDTAKAVGCLSANPGDVRDYLEVVGKGMVIQRAGPPVIAIPTTAGTGCEVTRNAVLADPHNQMKVSLRSPFLLPQAAVVDPELTYSIPPAITASTGMDALTQVLEPFVSQRANPMTDMFCREGMARAGRSLFKAFQNGGDSQPEQT